MDAQLIKLAVLFGLVTYVTPALADVGATPTASTPLHQHALPHPQRSAQKSGYDNIDRLAHTLMVRDLILQKYDSNGDGFLSAEEKSLLLKDAAAEQIEARKRVIQRFDKDGDGKLSSEERQLMRDSVAKRRAKIAGGMNHPAPEPTGSDAEGDAPPPHFVISNSQGQRMKVRPTLFLLSMRLLMEKYDRDGDGVLSEDEVAVADKDSRLLYATKAKQILDRYDLDGDGVLSPQERRLAVDQRKNVSGTDESTPDDIDLFIQESFDTEIMDSLVEGANEVKLNSADSSSDNQ